MEKSDVPVIVRPNSSESDANTINLPYDMDHKQEVIHDDASASTVCGATMSAPIPATEKDESPRAQLRRNIFPILQCYFTVALMGIQDGNFGIILPHLKLYYGASDSLISILFLIQAAGFFVMAFSNGYIVSKITQKGALYLGCSMMLLAYIILLFGFPFPVVCVTMVILGGGLSLLNAGCNVFIITAPYTTTVLNLLHACYAIGACISPIVTSALLANNLSWKVSYMILSGLAGLNLLGMVSSFWNTTIEVHVDPGIQNLPANGDCKPRTESLFKQTIKQRVTQVGAFFLLFYVGTEVTFGSWSFSFLTEVRGGNPVQLGQITSGYWAGLGFGRLFLGAITARFGEKRMVLLYVIITSAMIILIWQATPIAVDLTGLIILGMALGPIFPTTISLTSQVIPKHLRTTTIGFIAGLGQGGAALFPFINGQIANKLGIIGMMPFTLGLSLAMLLSWPFMPSTGPTINALTVYRQWKQKKSAQKEDIEVCQVPNEKI